MWNLSLLYLYYHYSYFLSLIELYNIQINARKALHNNYENFVCKADHNDSKCILVMPLQECILHKETNEFEFGEANDVHRRREHSRNVSWNILVEWRCAMRMRFCKPGVKGWIPVPSRHRTTCCLLTTTTRKANDVVLNFTNFKYRDKSQLGIRGGLMVWPTVRRINGLLITMTLDATWTNLLIYSYTTKSKWRFVL